MQSNGGAFVGSEVNCCLTPGHDLVRDNFSDAAVEEVWNSVIFHAHSSLLL